MINKNLFEQIERIQADECSYMIYKMLKARPDLTIEQLELVKEMGENTIKFYVQERKQDLEDFAKEGSDGNS
jgi:hypothetical protein